MRLIDLDQADQTEAKQGEQSSSPFFSNYTNPDQSDQEGSFEKFKEKILDEISKTKYGEGENQ